MISGPIQFGLTGWTARHGARLRKRWLPIVWRVVELTPEGYTVSITQEAGTFLVTNTPKQPPETPPVTPPVNPPGQKTLPQTGALWWPVPILAAAGLLLIAAGAEKNERHNKPPRGSCRAAILRIARSSLLRFYHNLAWKSASFQILPGFYQILHKTEKPVVFRGREG